MRPTLRPLALVFAIAFASGAQATDLLQAYDLARGSDPQLAAAESQKLAQGEGVVQSRSLLLPQIGGSASIGRSRSDSEGNQVFGGEPFPPSSSESNNRSRSVGVNLSQSIYNHGNYTGLRASRARAARAESDYESAHDFLMIRVADAYFNVLTAVETLAVARTEEGAVKRQLDQADQRFEVGLTAITDVHEARARYDAARASAIAAETSLFDAREALAEVTGEHLTGLRGLSEDFRPTLPSPQDPEAWVRMALDDNPVLRSRDLSLQASEHDIGTARSGHLPTVSLTAGWNDQAGWGSSRNLTVGSTTSFNNVSDGHSIGLQLNVPIFAGFATQSRVRQAIYSRDATADQLEQERRAVTRQTRNAYRALLAGISEIEARQQGVVSASSALEATEAGFEVGTRTIVDVLLAQQQQANAQREYARARHAFVVNSLRLRQAAGSIEYSDLENVNRLLTSDAEAAITLPQDE